ncbi:uncharacterized protein LOC113464818 [Ceratina calcarata]|uniref:Uncharacterized protein LOC113464818 n=1 Tax=Ceratina calcarata TaxID=156304 RepID=A0AAJ7S7N7_9HYME|nr:uncharacterized protein LOC113464818 [Ceratina calcarata]
MSVKENFAKVSMNKMNLLHNLKRKIGRHGLDRRKCTCIVAAWRGRHTRRGREPEATFIASGALRRDAARSLSTIAENNATARVNLPSNRQLQNRERWGHRSRKISRNLTTILTAAWKTGKQSEWRTLYEKCSSTKISRT